MEKQGLRMTAATATPPSTLALRRPYDWHVHLRDGVSMAAVVGATARVFGRAIVMPNLRPPVMTTSMAQAYRERILSALPAGVRFDPLMTLYLTDNTTPDEIATAKASGIVHAVKYYPAGATTHSDSGVTAPSAHTRRLVRWKDTTSCCRCTAKSPTPTSTSSTASECSSSVISRGSSAISRGYAWSSST
jgi:dihydroorotase